ncbi:hypothetical protein AB0424_12380 [Streptomyces sp. NPDC051180]|uniref:hypothetical protein n=1 Tax=Streptomyces sp. NPDC051180 TaxID=3155797 RepID=UPI00344F4DCD
MSLRMTESYATTVAAVAPVLLLVAAVEAHQFLRRSQQSSERMVEAYERAMAEVSARDPESSRTRLQEIAARVTTAARAEDPAVNSYGWVYFAWSSVAVSLLTSLILTLGWLADDGRQPDPVSAWISLISLITGGFVVCNLVVVTAIRASRREVKAARAYRAAIEDAVRNQAASVASEGRHS